MKLFEQYLFSSKFFSNTFIFEIPMLEVPLNRYQDNALSILKSSYSLPF